MRKTFQDRITLVGIKLYPCIGVAAGERNLAQACEADVTVWGDFAAAASTDSLDKSLDYCKLLATIQDTALSRKYNLLETLAYRMAHDVLQSYPASRVRVCVKKRPASLLDKVDFIEVEVEESREHS